MDIEMVLLPGAMAPSKGTPGSAGLDLYIRDEVYIMSGQTRLVGTGIKLSIPETYVGLIYERSSLHQRGLSLANKTAVIDSDYRGEIMLAITNNNQYSLTTTPGDRLAQLLIQKIPYVRLIPVESLDDTSRGNGGFGSTGGLYD